MLTPTPQKKYYYPMTNEKQTTLIISIVVGLLIILGVVYVLAKPKQAGFPNSSSNGENMVSSSSETGSTTMMKHGNVFGENNPSMMHDNTPVMSGEAGVSYNDLFKVAFPLSIDGETKSVKFERIGSGSSVLFKTDAGKEYLAWINSYRIAQFVGDNKNDARITIQIVRATDGQNTQNLQSFIVTTENGVLTVTKN